MNFDERNLNGITVFAAIAETGSFAAAGEVLAMSQPGVSRSLARLEARLGIRLFDRTTRSVTMTDEGERLYSQVIPLLAALDEAATSVTSGAHIVRGRLRVNVDPFFARLILGPRLGRFLDTYPELDLELTTRDRLGDMVADGFDLAVRFGEPRVSSLVARKLLDTRILTVAAPSYIKRYGRPSHPKALIDHRCIQFRDPESNRPFPWEFHHGDKRLVVETQSQLTVNDVGSLHSTCVAGYGIAQIMELGSELLLAEGRLIQLFQDWPDERFPLYALYPSRLNPSAKVRAFLDFVLTIVN
ncbi:LysR family transcriptional regulator [Pseudomonas kielensis]|uniref:LysR family transcriptional regulator n=1 Tax=Pseudomonas kielensis TaxID=2762577 RepID=UPI0038A0C3BC